MTIINMTIIWPPYFPHPMLFNRYRVLLIGHFFKVSLQFYIS